MGDVAAQKANIWVNSGYRQMRLCALSPSTICLHAGWGGLKHTSALYFGRRSGTTPHLRTTGGFSCLSTYPQALLLQLFI